MASWISKVTLTATVFFFYDHYASFEIGQFSLERMRGGGFSWGSMGIETRVALVLVGSNFVVLLLLFACAAPLLDCCFSALFGALRLLSFFLALLSFRDFGVFADLFQLKSSNTLPEIGKYCLFVFALEPLLGILVSLYPFISVLLGRQTVTYVVPPISGDAKSFKTQSGAQGRPEIDFAQIDEVPRGDETETVSTASLMLFTSCRAMVAPLSVHELLIGPNLIKAVRLNDGLLRAHWRSVLVALVVRIWCCCLFFTFPGSVAHPASVGGGMEELRGVPWYGVCSGASLVFLADIILTLVYLAFSQVIRLLALKRMEDKAMFRDLADIAFRLK
ncbi:hypothetical protein ETH_00000620, partial [Eimeria tenella]